MRVIFLKLNHGYFLRKNNVFFIPRFHMTVYSAFRLARFHALCPVFKNSNKLGPNIQMLGLKSFDLMYVQ